MLMITTTVRLSGLIVSIATKFRFGGGDVLHDQLDSWQHHESWARSFV